MARIDNLNNFLTDVADAIREKKGSADPIVIADFDTEIINLPSGEETNIYKVASIAERDELDATEGDICLVYNFGIYPITQQVVFNTIRLPHSFILSNSISGTKRVIFRREGASSMYDLEVSLTSTRCTISTMISPRINIRYTKSGGVYTSTNITDEYQDIELGYNYSYYSGWNDAIAEIITVPSCNFEGLFQYSNQTWDYLDININPDLNCIFSDTMIYSSGGKQYGTKDKTQIAGKRYKVVAELPTIEEAQADYTVNKTTYYIVNQVGLTSPYPDLRIVDVPLLELQTYSIEGSYTTPEGYYMPSNLERAIGEYNGYLYNVCPAGQFNQFSAICRFKEADGTSVEIVKDFSSSPLIKYMFAIKDHYLYILGQSSRPSYRIDLDTGDEITLTSYTGSVTSEGVMLIDGSTLVLPYASGWLLVYDIINDSWSTTRIGHSLGDRYIKVVTPIGNQLYLLGTGSGNSDDCVCCVNLVTGTTWIADASRMTTYPIYCQSSDCVIVNSEGYLGKYVLNNNTNKLEYQPLGEGNTNGFGWFNSNTNTLVSLYYGDKIQRVFNRPGVPPSSIQNKLVLEVGTDTSIDNLNNCQWMDNILLSGISNCYYYTSNSQTSTLKVYQYLGGSVFTEVLDFTNSQE